MLRPERPWGLRVAALVSLIVVGTSLGAKLFMRESNGGDFALVCGAANALIAGESPYDRAVLATYAPGWNMPVTYPPLVIHLVAPLCRSSGYFWIWLLLILATVPLLRGVSHVPLTETLAIVLGGFAATEWILLSGNPSVIELPLGALCLIGIVRVRPALTGAALGLAAFVKWSPLVALVAIFAIWPRRRALHTAGVALGVVAVLHGLSVLVDPGGTHAYWSALSTGFGGFLYEEAQLGGVSYPAIPSLANDMAKALGWVDLKPMIAACLWGGAAWLTWDVWRSRRTREDVVTAALLLILTAISLPRLKPYAFALLVPALVVLVGHMPSRFQAWTVALTCLLPPIALGAAIVLRPDGMVGLPPGLSVAFGYAPLMAAYGVVWMSLRTSARKPVG